LLSISLIIGFLTPYVSVFVCITTVVALIGGYLPDHLTLVCLIVNSAVLALLGPGAYSLDARLFGRRTVIVAPRNDDEQL
jgi:uncharacterized membrane protein YphA (DoxX/SURF4 family)